VLPGKRQPGSQAKDGLDEFLSFFLGLSTNGERQTTNSRDAPCRIDIAGNTCTDRTRNCSVGDKEFSEGKEK
jgi:hypothetical protein